MAETEQPISVGIVMRTRDRPVFVLRALASVAAQTYSDYKVMLVNDGGEPLPLDGAIAASKLPPALRAKLTVHHITPGVGRSAAFNSGVAQLDTDLIACLDDDDTWAPDFLSALVAFYRETQAKVPHLGGVAARATARREEIIEGPAGPQIRDLDEEGLPAAFLRPEFFINPLAYACYRQDLYPVQWLIRRDAILAVGGFPETFDVMEDRAFMNRLLARYRIAVLDRKLAFHHRRVNRATDTERDALLNTVDNPSYDWRLHADLARPEVDLAGQAELAATVRSVMADLLAEVNYETSAIWQKVDGEMRELGRRLDSDKAQILAELAARPGAVPTEAAPRMDSIARADVVYDLWQHHAGQPDAHHIVPGRRFSGRLELSIAGAPAGLLLHVAPDQRRLEVQIPQTRDWCALEIALDGLAALGEGLCAHVQLWSLNGYLF